MNTYKELKNRHQNEVNNFPMEFAFNQKQLEEGMKKLGLGSTDTDKIYSLKGTGGFYRRTDAIALHEMFDRHDTEMTEAIKQDETGDGFIFDMFNYELGNHEYIVTGETEDTIDALGLSEEEVENDPRLIYGLKKAIKSQHEWYAIHG